MESTRLHLLVFALGLWMTFPAQADEQTNTAAPSAQRPVTATPPQSGAVRVNAAMALDSTDVPPDEAQTPTVAVQAAQGDEPVKARVEDGVEVQLISPTVLNAPNTAAKSPTIAADSIEQLPTKTAELPAKPEIAPIEKTAVQPQVEADAAQAQPVISQPSATEVAAAPRRLIPRNRDEATAAGADSVDRATNTTADRSAAVVPWYRGPYAALGGVLALIATLTVLVRRYLPAARPIAADALKVVGRAPISAKQSAILLHVGNRLVLVGVSGEGMRTLAEITDPQEVSLLLGRTVGRGEVGAGFDTLLADQLDRFDEEPDDHTEEVEAVSDTLRVARGELESLRTRIRALHSA
ncbi:MAG: flagellar biosynthetic protein FliO [Phycisphaerales bacterium]|nr:flagellar biosynthetic protein FliO [Phycisphaerales bacterium]